VSPLPITLEPANGYSQALDESDATEGKFSLVFFLSFLAFFPYFFFA
jgi:hypothetical protein